MVSREKMTYELFEMLRKKFVVTNVVLGINDYVNASTSEHISESMLKPPAKKRTLPYRYPSQHTFPGGNFMFTLDRSRAWTTDIVVFN